MAVCQINRYRWPRNLGELLQGSGLTQKNAYEVTHLTKTKYPLVANPVNTMYITRKSDYGSEGLMEHVI